MPSAFELLVVSLGGAGGSLIRYFFALLSMRICGGSTLAGTLVANCAGCFAIGLLYGILANHPNWISPTAAIGVRVGLLGGLTTFSTFAAESVFLANAGRTGLMLVYLLSSVGIGLFAVFSGMWLVSTEQGTPS